MTHTLLPDDTRDRLAPEWRRSPPVLAGRLTTVREITVADAADLFPALTTEAVTRFIPTPPPTLHAFEGFVRRSIDVRAAGGGIYFAVVPRDRQAASGLVALWRPAHDDGLWNVGFILAEDAWGRGLMQDALTTVLRYSREAIGLQAIEAWTMMTNTRAHRVLERLGGIAEVRPDSVASDGRRADHLRWVLTCP